MYRTASEGTAPAAGSSSKIWRLPMSLRKKSSRVGKEGKGRSHRSQIASIDLDDSSQLRSVDSNSLYEMQENNYRQLQSLVQRMRTAPSGPNHVDSAYKEFERLREPCSTLCYGILQDEIGSTHAPLSPPGASTRQGSLAESPQSPGATIFDQRSSFSGRSLTEVATGSAIKPGPTHELWLNAIRDWKNCLETLCEAFKVSLADTYKSYERDATPDMVNLLFSSKKFRREAVHRMRNASVTRVLSADPQFFPRYEIRFRNYERVKKELMEIRQLLQSGESGISPSREVQEFPIAPRGDAILEFANIGVEALHADPVLRFRVSSYMLAETSPIFARMFSGHASSHFLHEAEDIIPQLPPFPTPYVCKDGTEVKLYRMPQHEVNQLQAFEILMHAAHMHNELVPREVSFEQFVAIAECSMRFKSTSPLELVVEHRWLPQWMHRGAAAMPDGLMVISYAFGSRQLFTRMSKTAILTLESEQELQSKPWPQKIKDKIWAIRCAKVAQLHSCCTNAIQEYIRAPNRDTYQQSASGLSSAEMMTMESSDAPPAYESSPTSSPRCPKGSHNCDAVNLGWMMLIFSEMGLARHILQPSVVTHITDSQEPSKSLVNMVEMLKTMPSPAAPVHRGGVCDPSPTFRNAISDIYNSVTGLTLYDISGKSHGWALSKHWVSEPQTVPTTGLDRMAAGFDPHTVVAEFPDTIRLQILDEIDNIRDLHAAAQINRGFYETYRAHELTLMRNILRADRFRGAPVLAQRGGNAEDKILKLESDQIKKEGPIEGADAVTIMSDDYEDTSNEDDEDDLVGLGGAETPPFVVEPPRYTEDEVGSSGVSASPTTPRQLGVNESLSPRPSTSKPNEAVTVHIDEPPMTDEEVRNILWPEPMAAVSPASVDIPSVPIEAIREKFLAGDMVFAERPEDKTLLIDGDKQLSNDLASRIDLGKVDQSDRPCSPQSRSEGSE